MSDSGVERKRGFLLMKLILSQWLTEKSGRRGVNIFVLALALAKHNLIQYIYQFVLSRMCSNIFFCFYVQENIGAFGGDRGNVTLMGQGKGAAFVNFLMISNALPKGKLMKNGYQKYMIQINFRENGIKKIDNRYQAKRISFWLQVKEQ